MPTLIKDILTVNIAKKADLIIGQIVPLTITLTAKNAINPTNASFIITPGAGAKNISFSSENIKFTRLPDSTSVYTASTKLIVSSDPNVIKERDPIKFTIEANGSNADKFDFEGTAKTINPDTLSLMLSDMFLDTPNNDPKKPVKGATVTTLLLDKENNPLSNTPIIIRSKIPENLSYCKILDSDNKTEILLQKIGDYTGLSINSDKDGNIKFYIYPQKSDSMVLELESWIVNVGKSEPAASPLFIVNTEIPDFMHSVPEPNILGAFARPLVSEGGEPDFQVGVYDYPNAKKGDYILFFTQDLSIQNSAIKYSGHYVIVNDPKTELGLGKYFYSVPCNIFEAGVSYNFSYIIIQGQGAGSLTSLQTTVTYMGGATYSPDTTIKRHYDPCNVYNSLGVINNPPIPQGITLGYDSIKKYLSNHPQDPNTPVTGLFIEIVGDTNVKTSAPLGSKVTLNMYIQAANCNTKKPVGQKIMPITKNQDTGRYSLIFHIAKEDLVNITGGAGRIWFDYEVGHGSDIRYGKIWAGRIDTRSEDLTDDENDGN
ncbi:conserved protein of unknown function [Xenorhabdus poinarii G6]|uniref:Uncharacterized protein n=1 Tax=Xenorhabdus poinarii G6 TaxID=1354304 RepID=A0A068QY21_9GAMM|nr:hypothetical protein [Xenorhabdus poinarii]CDG19833.1 conserved protein of unknown function [Xenorhabdus poinarii G6]